MRFLSLLVVVAAAASGQTAGEIVKKSAATYQSLKSYRFEAQVVEENVRGDRQSRNVTTRIAVAGPLTLRRIELKGGRAAALRVRSPNAFFCRVSRFGSGIAVDRHR